MSDATTTHDDDDRAMIKGISAAVNETVTLGKQTTASGRPKSGEGAETSEASHLPIKPIQTATGDSHPRVRHHRKLMRNQSGESHSKDRHLKRTAEHVTDRKISLRDQSVGA